MKPTILISALLILVLFLRWGLQAAGANLIFHDYDLPELIE